MGQVGGGDELGLAHGPGPGAAQRGARGVARTQDFQGRLDLPLGPAAAAAVSGQGGHAAQHIHVALDAAEVALHRPDGDQYLARHAELLLNGREKAQRLAERPSLAHTVLADRALHIVADRPGKFRLAAVGGDDARIGGQAGELAVDLLGAVAVQQQPGAKSRQPAGEIQRRGLRRELRLLQAARASGQAIDRHDLHRVGHGGDSERDEGPAFHLGETRVRRGRMKAWLEPPSTIDFKPPLAYRPASITPPGRRPRLRIRFMKVRSSLKSLKGRHRDCKLVRRKGKIFVINKTDPRFKAKQG